MSTYLALFRGINIGGHNKVPMQDLASLLAEEGCRNVRTYIQSGNVIFDTRRRNRKQLCSDIREPMLQRFGFTTGVILLNVVELQEAIAHNPFRAEDGKAIHFLFLQEQPATPDFARMDELKSDAEAYKLGNKVCYLYTPEGAGGSRLAVNAERCLGVVTTGRNWNTVRRLASMLGSAGAAENSEGEGRDGL